MKLFNIDFHISVIADVRMFLSELGHDVDSLSLSNHTWVFGRTKDSVPELDGMSFDSFGQRDCDRFFEARSRQLDSYDGFLVTHSPCLSGLYEKSGKPVICVVSTRYDTFCQTPSSKAWLDDLLSRMHESGQLILLANNAYDAWHVHRHLGITPRIVPSFCGYTGARWSTPSRPPVFLGRTPLAGLSGLPCGHTWSDVADSASCVAVPYNVSVMSIFERHTMGMPILVPSPEWTARNPSTLSELRHRGAPVPEEVEAAIRLADWYTGELPGISFFKSEDDLRSILSDGVPPVTGMGERKHRILEEWRMALNQMPFRKVVSSGHPKPAIDVPVGPTGFWRWCDGFFGELRPDGNFIQHQEGNLEMRWGSWAPTPSGFDIELTGFWTMQVELDTPAAGTWRMRGSPKPSGAIRKLGDTRPCLAAEERRRLFSCDSYRLIANKSTFVLHTGNVIEWHRRFRPEFEYVLVTTHSDLPVDGRFRGILNDERLVRWYATNIREPHSKLRPIPLGVYHRQGLLNPEQAIAPDDYDQLLEKAARAPRTKRFNVSFATCNNPATREGCLRATGLPNVYMKIESFIADLGCSQFCISPEGGGIDCHRTWEALCCRTIPVITWNPMVSMGLYDGLPVIILDRWEDFNEADFTSGRYERMMRDFDPAVLQMDRWIEPAFLYRHAETMPKTIDTTHDPKVASNYGRKSNSVTSPHPDPDCSVHSTPSQFVGYYRWAALFYGEFLEGGVFIQHSVLNLNDQKPGRWWHADGKLWFELAGYWTKYALPTESGPSPLFLVGHGEFGRLSRIREADKYYATPKATSATSIPKIIHACWFSGSELGDLQRRCIASWQKHLPDYEIIIWDKHTWNPEQFLFSQEAFENGQWAFVSDVHRLDVLYRFGGIYLDLDVEVRKSFDPFLSHEFFTGTEPIYGLYLTSTPYIMGCKKGNKLIKEFLDYYSNRNFVRPDDTFDKRHNTSIIHETMISHGARNRDNIVDEFIPGHFKYPSWVLAFDSHLTYAVHHFDNAWLHLPWSLPTRAARASIFSSIYDSNSQAIGSDPGSTPEYTTEYREFLANYMKRNRISSVLDVGCGDWQFCRLLDWSGIDYLGLDVVPKLVHTNNRKFGAEGIRFEVRDSVDDELPHADLVIIKDVLQHLSFASVRGVLDNLREFDRVLIAQDVDGVNHDCSDGGYRPLNVTIPPFNLAARKVFDFRKVSKVVFEWRPKLDGIDRRSEILGLLSDIRRGHTTRYGPKHDGGYVVPTLDYTTIITVGVGSDVRFEVDYSNTQPDARFSFYDPTVSQLPTFVSNSEFERIGLGSGLVQQLVTLDDILSRSRTGPDDVILLKVDCEGCEWDCEFEKADLSGIAAIVLEVHDIGDTLLSSSQFEVLSKLFSEFTCLNVHPNNYGGASHFNGILVPKVLELTFLNKNISQAMFNMPENHPCNPNAPELSTGWEWRTPQLSPLMSASRLKAHLPVES